MLPSGVFLVTFSLCMHILLFKSNGFPSSSAHKKLVSSPPIKWNMVLVALAMFVLATLDVAFGLRHNLDAFVYYTGSGGAIAEFSLVSNWVNVMKSADFLAQTAIGDAMLVRRLFCLLLFFSFTALAVRSTAVGSSTGSDGPPLSSL